MMTKGLKQTAKREGVKREGQERELETRGTGRRRGDNEHRRLLLSSDYELGVLHNNKVSQNSAQSDTEKIVEWQ